MKLQDFKKELLRNKQFRQEYHRYDLAFEIGQKISEARIISGITQHKLSELVGTKQSSIARLESGKSLPSMSFLERIALALKTNVKVSFDLIEDAKVSSNTYSVTTTSLITFVERDSVLHFPLEVKSTNAFSTYDHMMKGAIIC